MKRRSLQCQALDPYDAGIALASISSQTALTMCFASPWQTPTYSAELLQEAQKSPRFVEEVEATFANFLGNKLGSQRLALRPMTRSQRAIVHSLAEARATPDSVNSSVSFRCFHRISYFAVPSLPSPLNK
jgi:hypothetical protein